MWVLDSGASQHMSNCRDLFKTYEKLQYPVHVTIGDKSWVKGIGIGTVSLPGHGFDLQEVLHVPELVENLISVRAATARGAEVNFKGTEALIMLRGATIARAVSTDGMLYRLKDYYGAQAMLADKSDITAGLWHRRFGHLGYDNLSRLVSEDMVQGIPTHASGFIKAGREKCAGCILCKQVRAQYRPSETHTTRRLAMVHMDVVTHAN